MQPPKVNAYVFWHMMFLVFLWNTSNTTNVVNVYVCTYIHTKEDKNEHYIYSEHYSEPFCTNIVKRDKHSIKVFNFLNLRSRLFSFCQFFFPIIFILDNRPQESDCESKIAMSNSFVPRSEKATKYQQQNILGGFNSFEGDSLPDYSEFDTDSVTLEYYKERYNNSPDLNALFIFLKISSIFCDERCVLYTITLSDVFSMNNFLKIVEKISCLFTL